jgi:hypothetical protein
MSKEDNERFCVCGLSRAWHKTYENERPSDCLFTVRVKSRHAKEEWRDAYCPCDSYREFKGGEKQN